MKVDDEDRLRRLTFRGRLDPNSIARLWGPATRAVRERGDRAVRVDLSDVDYCDGAGLALLTALAQLPGVTLENLSASVASRLGMFDRSALSTPADHSRRDGLVTRIGRVTVDFFRGLHELISFIGQSTVVGLHALARPRRIRWKDVVLVAERAGSNAFPIVGLIGFLMGLIMAFQSALPMQQFGVEIFVADLVAISMIKELGPLMAAVVLAGRSGSAFAAELGTMTVNEEISALTTMGIDPVRFLIVPRMIAAVIASPILGLICSLFGLAGGAVVLLSLGYPL
ncbi:MAG: ABC transporter permease, partial [Planctomycetes bacterium]|nr:ABC transporter permease [Planctomycetota bacterium]